MNKKIKYFFIAFLQCASIASSIAQSRKADSLRSVLKNLDAKSSHEFLPAIKGSIAGLGLDTIRINALNGLAWELKNSIPDTSIILSTQALQLSQNNKWQKGEGNSYHNLGVFNYFKGNFLLALDFDFKALTLWEKLLSADNNPKSIIFKNKSTTIRNMGGVYVGLGKYPQALDCCFKALKMAEALRNQNGVAENLSNIGIVYKIQGDNIKALEYYFKALKMSEDLSDKAGIARIYGNIGNVYNEQANEAKLRQDSVRRYFLYNKALEYDFKALKMFEKLEDKNGIARIYGNIGNVYDEQASMANSPPDYIVSDSLYIKALDYYFKALKITEDLGGKNEMALHLGNIGNVCTNMKRYKEAEEYLKKALVLSTLINSMDLMKDHQQRLSMLYEQTNQSAKALEYYKKYIATRDSIYNEENTKKTVRSEMNFEFEKKQAIAKAEQEKQNAIAQKEKQKQNIILILVSAFLLLVVVFAGFMFNRWRITQQQKKIIEKQKEKIIDSISYAQLIQQSILMEESEIQKYLPNSFIYYQPKDIVSGDFYWFSEVVGSSELVVGSKKENDPNFSNNELQTTNFKLIIAAIDCTGHGVPGAFMSMIGNTLLNQIVNEKQITTPSEILRLLNIGVFEALHQQKDGALSLDGMDISLCCIDYKKNELQYAGAQNPLYVITDNEITVINADRQTIGGGGLISKQRNQLKMEYTNHIVQIKKGMCIYLFTDGYMDQFGSPDKASVVKGKKFGIQKFKELLLNNQHLSMQQQKKLIDAALENWKGNISQTDDILVMGFRL